MLFSECCHFGRQSKSDDAPNKQPEGLRFFSPRHRRGTAAREDGPLKGDDKKGTTGTNASTRLVGLRSYPLQANKVPFQGTGVLGLDPTAAPWAGESKPFGLPNHAPKFDGKRYIHAKIS